MCKKAANNENFLTMIPYLDELTLPKNLAYMIVDLMVLRDPLKSNIKWKSIEVVDIMHEGAYYSLSIGSLTLDKKMIHHQRPISYLYSPRDIVTKLIPSWYGPMGNI